MITRFLRIRRAVHFNQLGKRAPIHTLAAHPRSQTPPLRLCTTPAEAQLGLQELVTTSNNTLALDFEGIQISRTGTICLAQVATETGVLLLDCNSSGVLSALRLLLEDSRVLKIVHDVREDSSNLFYQHGVLLQHVFDTQVALRELIPRLHPAEISLASALERFTNTSLPQKSYVKSLMNKNPFLWSQRPLPQRLLQYAAQDVLYLHQLKHAIEQLSSLRKNGIHAEFQNRVLQASEKAISYCFLNQNIPALTQEHSIGVRCKALVSSTVLNKVYLRLNMGYNISGVGRAEDYKNDPPGSLVDCVISGWLTQDAVIVNRV